MCVCVQEVDKFAEIIGEEPVTANVVSVRAHTHTHTLQGLVYTSSYTLKTNSSR